MNLSKYNINNKFDRGSSFIKECLWYFFSYFFFASSIPGSKWRCLSLRIFGARIGNNVIFKTRIIIKFPWRLVIGNNSWIGEGVWIDNLAPVIIGNNVCISQGAYLCTGNHDWNSAYFELITKGIIINDKCWVAAKAILTPGTIFEEGAILGTGAVGKGKLKAWTIYSTSNIYFTSPRKQKYDI